VIYVWWAVAGIVWGLIDVWWVYFYKRDDMGWIKKVPKPHRCPVPHKATRKRWLDSVWRCRHCGQKWVMTDIRYEDQPVWKSMP
jgi:hypothetical protein